MAVTKLHESFASRVSSSLGAHLRVGIEINLASVEQLSYREFLSRLQDLTYLASLRVMPIDACAALQMDIALTYPMIDVVLGGSGSGATDPRELTEIEELILETVVRMIGLELQNTWGLLSIWSFDVSNANEAFRKTYRTPALAKSCFPGSAPRR